ncbi:MAG: DUF1080 domain-containing protein [Cyclobacteriaceae bacterium]
MPKNSILKLCLILSIFSACSQKSEVEIAKEKPEEKEQKGFSLTSIKLQDLSAFKKTTANWSVAGDVFADFSKEKTLSKKDGIGILANIEIEGKNQHIFTVFEHGDIELEFDVMMPKGSNSGVYFQSRYEVQLFDSWGVKEPYASDIGGIYQRWDAERGKGNEGYEGHPPKINAGKAPGLWQHFRIVFHAPRFDENGGKIKNAWFEEVWLNGVLIHENVEVTGPTRAAAYEDELASAPLMIQGDHGPVAFRNFKYRKYSGSSITFSDMNAYEYEWSGKELPNLETLTPRNTYTPEVISYKHATTDDKFLLYYRGRINIPTTDDYKLVVESRNPGAIMLIGNDTLLDGNKKDYASLAKRLIKLDEGQLDFKFILNKPDRGWRKGLALYAESQNMQKHGLHGVGSAFNEFNTEPIVIKVEEETVLQRSFINHTDRKRSHCISAGTPEGINYTYDLEYGSVLQVWGGPFLDVTKMWHGRGQPQLGRPIGSAITMHEDPDFSFLENENEIWPDTVVQNKGFKQLGYELDARGNPTFSYALDGIVIKNKLTPSAKDRILRRKVTIDAHAGIWHKIAEGKVISKIKENSFAIDDNSYLIELVNTDELDVIQRNSEGRDELLLKIPSSVSQIQYNIIW